MFLYNQNYKTESTFFLSFFKLKGILTSMCLVFYILLDLVSTVTYELFQILYDVNGIGKTLLSQSLKLNSILIVVVVVIGF